ncbi:MAG: prolyl oligopeptidase family serine peptidase, partial [Myxococcota bacterium]
RRGFATQLRFAAPGAGTAPDLPPPDIFQLVRYPAPLGASPAYVSVVPPAERNTKKPGIVWIIGGFDFGISAFAWEPQPRHDDQTAAAFREAGLVLMLPALRGFSGAPGQPECFYGEVDDILAAGRYLASRPEVDPSRVYLGGHSTGGTLALLAAESQIEVGPFAAVFAFGPAADPRSYEVCPPPDLPDESYEALLRAPIFWAANLGAPTWVIEGEHGNADAVELIGRVAGRAPLHTTIVRGAGHFDVLRPASELIARQLLAGTEEDPLGAIDLSESAILAAMRAGR